MPTNNSIDKKRIYNESSGSNFEIYFFILTKSSKLLKINLNTLLVMHPLNS
jgi:hypothetical protein